jgi:hypothetical protein
LGTWSRRGAIRLCRPHRLSELVKDNSQDPLEQREHTTVSFLELTVLALKKHLLEDRGEALFLDRLS